MIRIAIVLALALFVPSAPVAAQTCINTTDLLAWWRADGSAADATGVRHGTFVGTERYEAGPSGQAFSFDGASYVNVPNDGSFTGNAGVTVAAWIKRGSQFGFLGPIFKMPGLDGNSGIAFEMFGPEAHFYVAVEANEFHGGGWPAPAGAFIPADVWTHVAGTYDGTYLRFYLNGQLVASSHVPGKIRPAGGEFHIGHDPINPDRFVRGPIDDAVVFGRALYDGEVALLHQGALGACPLDARERPAITWSPSSNLTTMTALGGAHFNAQSAVPGRFEYSFSAGTRLTEGRTTLVATFIPDDQVQYQITKVYRQVSVLWQDFTTERSAPVITSVAAELGGSDVDVVVDASRDHVWTVSRSRNALVVLDGKTGAEIAVIPASTPLNGTLAFDRVRDQLYAAGGYSVAVFDARTHAEIRTFTIPAEASAAFVDEAGENLYLGFRMSGRLERFALPVASTTLEPAGHWDVGGTPSHIASDPVGKLLYIVTGQNSQQLWVIDTDPGSSTFRSVIASHQTNAMRAALAVNPRTGLAYLGEGFDNRGVMVFDGRRGSQTFGTFLTSLPLPLDLSSTRGVTGLTVNPVTNIVYAQTADVRDVGSYIMVELFALDATTGALLSQSSLEPAQLDIRRNFGGGRIAINVATSRLYVLGDIVMYAIQENYALTRTVPDDSSPSPVTVTTSGAKVTFSDVVTGGAVSVTALDVSAASIASSGQFKLSEAVGFEISTTATVAAPFTVCLNASHVTDAAAFASLSLLHAETINGLYQWVDRTVSRDFNTGMVCGQTMSLSPFAVAQRVGPRYSLKTTFDARARQAGSVIPVRVRAMQDGVDVSSAGLVVTAVDVVNIQTGLGAVAANAGAANRSGAFRFDASTGEYIFNLSTRAMAPGSYTLRVRIGTEPGTHDIRFEVR